MEKIPIYVISLKRTPERRLYMQRQLDSLGLEYQWIDAVDVYDFTKADLEGVDTKQRNQPTAMACLLSHVKFYDRVIKDNHEIACVLEDDSELLPSFPEVLNYEKLQKEDWGVLLLLHFSLSGRRLLREYSRLVLSAGRQESFSIYGAYILGAITKNFPKKYTKNHYIAKMATLHQSRLMQPLGTGAYLVRLSVAKKLGEIALANQKFILADDLTGCADSFGIPLKLITPPCVRCAPVYTKYSTIVSADATTATIPHQKILQWYIRNKWIILAPSTFGGKLSLKLRWLLLSNLKHLYKLIIRGLTKNYFAPRSELNIRLPRIQRK